MSNLSNLKVEGHVGTWYEIGGMVYEGKSYTVLEHEEYGNDADWIVIDTNTKQEVTDEVIVTKAMEQVS